MLLPFSLIILTQSIFFQFIHINIIEILFVFLKFCLQSDESFISRPE